MNIDWKDALSGLRDSLPEEEEPEVDVTNEESKGVQKSAVHIVVERKGRKGKTATIIEGFECEDDELKELAKTLKQKTGTGGSARGGEILLQGECREKAAELLRSMGYKVK